MALIHGKPDDISFGKSETNPELRSKLFSFRDKVMDGRLAKFWETAKELPGLVALSLTKTIKTYPAVGWVRANLVANEDILLEINQLRKENSELQRTVSDLNNQQQPEIDGIADIDSEFTIHGNFTSSIKGSKYPFDVTLSWCKIFALISPYLLKHPSDKIVKSELSTSVFELANKNGYSPSINDQEFKTITIQLQAYNLITTSYSKTVGGGMGYFWSLTKKGNQLMVESRVIR